MIYFAILKLVKLNVVNDGFFGWSGETIYKCTTVRKWKLLLVVSPQFNANAIQDYALRWEIETLFSCLKGRGFNLENTRLTDPRRVKKLIAVLAISFCWCYLTGEWQHDQKKAIKIKKHGRLSMSLFSLWFRLCSNGDSAFNWFWEKEEFKEILAILRRQNPDRIRVL